MDEMEEIVYALAKLTAAKMGLTVEQYCDFLMLQEYLNRLAIEMAAAQIDTPQR